MTTARPPSDRTPAAGRYRIDPQRSAVRYTGRHMFGLGGVRATFRLTSGTITVADPVTESTVAMTVDAASFTSDKQRRDAHVQSAALLDAKTYPEITFASTQVRPDGSRFLVHGEVTAHGVSRPVEIVVDQVNTTGTEATAHAVVKLDRYEFGVTGVKGMAGRRLTLDFDLVAVAE